MPDPKGWICLVSLSLPRVLICSSRSYSYKLYGLFDVFMRLSISAGTMVEHSNIHSLSNFQQMFCFTKPTYGNYSKNISFK